MEQKQVVKYMRSNGRYKPYNVIERLQVDLYQASIKQRSERQSYCFQLLYFFVFDVLNVV
jgi:spore coat protein CotF